MITSHFIVVRKLRDYTKGVVTYFYIKSNNRALTMNLISQLYIVLAISAAPILSGCSPIQGYDGPRRPDNEIAWLYFFASFDASFKDIRVDGRDVSVWASGISLLPGPHDVAIRASVESAICSTPETELCVPRRTDISCSVTPSLVAGRRYRVELMGAVTTATITIVDPDKAEFVTSGTCS